MKKYQTALVIGSGAFGQAIAHVLSFNFNQVIIKSRHQTFLELENKMLGKCQLIVSALPSSALAEFYAEHYEFFLRKLIEGIPLVSLSKGIDHNTLELPDDMFFNIYPHFKDQIMFLSGPSFASEILKDNITCVTIAGRSKKHLEQMVEMFHTPFFKAFYSYDVKGVLIGGALKNVLAIGCGLLEGLGFEANTNAVMLTRGIHEMLRFGLIYNARPETFYGLSGMGDLILTTTGNKSRNKQFGRAVGEGQSPQQLIKNASQVVEGYKTTAASYALIEKFEIRAQIFCGIYDVLYTDKKPKEVIFELMAVPSKLEF